MINSNIFTHFPQIKFTKYNLRQLQKTDAKDYLRYLQKYELKAFLTTENIPSNIKEAEAEIAYWRNLFTEKKSIYWAISLQSTNQLIGTIGFNVIDWKNKIADLSYDLDVEFWNQGIMSKSLQEILNFANHKLDLTTIRATCAIHNIRSINLLKKYNFKQVKLLENYEILAGQSRDYFLYIRSNDMDMSDI